LTSGFGSSVFDYHKCLSILLEPIAKAQTEHPLLDVLLGDQIKRVRAIVDGELDVDTVKERTREVGDIFKLLRTGVKEPTNGISPNSLTCFC
jgi:hypothetical protein